MNTEYLQESVGKYLSKALCEVAIRRPERPVEFLAYQLIALYEKDLEMQKAEKGEDLKEESESATDLTVTAQLSQMFMRKLSTSMSRMELDDISPAAASPSISIGLDDELTEEDKPLSDKENLLGEELMTSSGEEEPLERRDSKSSGEKEEGFPKKEGETAVADSIPKDNLLEEEFMTSSDEKEVLEGRDRKSSGEKADLQKKDVETIDDDSVQKTSSLSLTDLYNLKERRPSAVRDNEPITEVETKEFGTSDPFLARRNTNLFDVNFAPIGDPSNQSEPAP